ncbi:MAG: zinc ABC transporter substrate-binding protein [Erysipelotrichaceae bacterium]|nr:zinc ABC transporter substrate-binding protein [Erysipelotrichaceae bacterium]MDD3923838.1 zinc ABC transporter substrate-binding protein [Erysipelotrichaceae bacterium]MDD4642379.1 zinc ABC transporter substrate-binding protein [Erysipelotrichaceae bacterium]
MKKIMTIISIVLSLSLVGCANKETVDKDKKPIIAVSIVPEATFVEAVVMDKAEVITMIPPGFSPENHEPTAELMVQLEEATVYFAIGVPAEISNILPYVDEEKTVLLHEYVANVYPDRTFAEEDRDPHIWLSPKRVKIMIDRIALKMGELDPDNKDFYLANASAYIEKLDALDLVIKKSVDELINKKFIAYHPSFGYLADDYGLTMYALEEEGKEATARHLQDMIDLAKAEGIKAIFYQKEIDSSQSEAFAEELGGVTIQLEPLAADYIDNLKLMVDTLAKALK